MGEQLPDEALMQRMARDDTAAFDALFLRHRRAVFSYTLRMVGDGTTAEDLTQDCFLRVWRARSRYQPTAAFRTWLFTIARRLALDELKKPRTRGMLLAADMAAEEDRPEEAEPVADPARTNPQEILMSRELARQMEMALAGLPEELREVVVLRDVEEMSYDEIARVLDCPLGTVKSRLNAARRRLRAVALEWMGLNGG
jgi:RNA polymerase sigma-70 factor (ECF subfamily)